MSKINKWHFYLIYLLFSSIYASNCLAAGGGNGSVVPETNTTTSSTTSVPDTNSTYTPTGTTSDLSGTYNNNSIVYPNSSAFSASSFSGYSTSFGSNCGFTLFGGYVTNGNSNLYQLQASYNTNPCTDQKVLQEISQENETKREVIRANTQIIITCINARTQAVQNKVNPDIVCKLSDFQMPKSP